MKKAEEILRDIREHPESHRHEFDGLIQCCTTEDGIDTRLVEAHEKYCSVGTNGGRRCDVTSGPCSCGAWH